ncbi:TRAP transporter small permease subunit [Roseivirga sp. BDSF3-8]|uniref:TRAP transporter small permease subunit n=1 Tax=Roseivirga sp. BDSF3-8 TaxID=3241598 RepID=UPI003531BC30
MISVLQKIVMGIDHFTEFAGKLVSWVTVLLVLVVFYDVVTRYFFNYTTVATIELEWHLFSLIFLLGAGYALKHDRHVRVDVFYTRFSEKKKAMINLTGSLLFLIPFCAIVIYAALPFVQNSYSISETSPDPGGLPGRFVIKGAIVIGFSLLLIQAIGELLRNLLIITRKSSGTIHKPSDR